MTSLKFSQSEREFSKKSFINEKDKKLKGYFRYNLRFVGGLSHSHHRELKSAINSL